MNQDEMLAIENAADRLIGDHYYEPEPYNADVAIVCNAAKQFAAFYEATIFPDDPSDYERFGCESAEEEKRAGYAYATGREERRRQFEETYDGDHPAFYERRKACIDAFLAGYYERWMELNNPGQDRPEGVEIEYAQHDERLDYRGLP